jgi:hypothetical protein
MNDHENDLPPSLEKEWREWTATEPAIDENRLRRELMQKIPDRGPRPARRLVLVAAAVSLLAVIIGIESVRGPQATVATDDLVVHETGSNVILVAREGMEPIYIATERSNGEGVTE